MSASRKTSSVSTSSCTPTPTTEQKRLRRERRSAANRAGTGRDRKVEEKTREGWYSCEAGETCTYAYVWYNSSSAGFANEILRTVGTKKDQACMRKWDRRRTGLLACSQLKLCFRCYGSQEKACNAKCDGHYCDGLVGLRGQRRESEDVAVNVLPPRLLLILHALVIASVPACG